MTPRWPGRSRFAKKVGPGSVDALYPALIPLHVRHHGVELT